MRIDVWSDVACPWCYIGKRRLETALSDFEHAEDVEIVWHSFELDPTAPTHPTETVPEMLGRKYGGGREAGLAMISQVDRLAAQEGLVFRQAQALHANTHDAHRLVHLARQEQGLQGQAALTERLLATYFVEAGNIADHATLTRVAVETGLDPARVAQVLAGDEFADAVADDVRQARELGANGVPFYVIDGRYGISGAQPAETFSQVLRQAASDG